VKNRCIVLPALAVAFLAPASAQPPAPDAGIVAIAHIALRVSDLNREIAFLGKLGYQQSFAFSSAGKTTEVFIKVNDRQFIELYPQTNSSDPLGWVHACFEAGDLSALVSFFRAQGLNPAPVRKGMAGNLISTLSDPDGRVTEFTQYMPGSRHLLDTGQHLGIDRVATELLGFDLPVNALAADRQFYTQMGFEAEVSDSSVRFTTPGAPGMRVELRPARPGAQPEILFTVPDARIATDRLRNAGANPTRQGKLLFLRDPDGNLFVFLESSPEHKKNLLPWKH
jgi:catechol 2,3-dioxygenase-like lactoylglutathione lyase family enzyme